MIRRVFDGDEVGSVWIEGTSEYADSHALITISNPKGEHSVVITPTSVRPAEARDFVDAPKERVVTKKKRNARRMGSLITYTGYALTAVLLVFVSLSLTGVVQARVVLTGSMAPTIKPGDVVLLKPQRNVEPHIGDIVTYTGRRFDGTPVSAFTHRIIGGNSIQGYLLKGDANPSPDIQKVKTTDIVGTVIFVVPFIGKLLIPKNLVTVIPLLFVLWLMVDRWRNE